MCGNCMVYIKLNQYWKSKLEVFENKVSDSNNLLDKDVYIQYSSIGDIMLLSMTKKDMEDVCKEFDVNIDINHDISDDEDLYNCRNSFFEKFFKVDDDVRQTLYFEYVGHVILPENEEEFKGVNLDDKTMKLCYKGKNNTTYFFSAYVI